MTNAIQSTSPTSTENQEPVVWPEYTPSSEHRHFIERLKRARIECGFSIPDMAERVRLGLRLAHEFEDLVTPLPFSHLEIWCQAVGVPFEDYLALYWAEMEPIMQAREREAQERKAGQNTPCITNTEAGEAEAPAPALSRSPRGTGLLSPLRSAFAHISRRFLSPFSTNKKTPK